MKMTPNDKNLQILFNELVPRIGKASSLAGEIVRAAGRISHRWFNDGDQIGIGYGKETCNAPARFLLAHGNNKIRTLIAILWGLTDYEKYESFLDQLVGEVVDFINSNPDLRTQPTEDMFDYSCKDQDVEED